MTLLNWVTQHWFDVLQTSGIVGGLIFTGLSLRRDSKIQRLQNSLTITKQHREIWTLLFTLPELARILDAKADIAKSPVSREEELFVKFLLFHLLDSYRALKANLFEKPEGLGKDIGEFLLLPIPRCVWEKIKPYQDRRFVAFVEEYVDNKAA